MVCSTIAANLRQLIGGVRIKTCKVEARTELIDIVLKLVGKEDGFRLIVRDVKFRGIACFFRKVK